MRNKKERLLPVHGGKYPRSGGWGETLVRKPFLDSYPPSTSLRSATSPRMRGEDILSPSRPPHNPNSLAVRHGAIFGFPNQKLETRRA